jgi:hypothetical protein
VDTLDTIETKAVLLMVGIIWVWGSIVPFSPGPSSQPAVTYQHYKRIEVIDMLEVDGDIFALWVARKGTAALEILEVDEDDGRHLLGRRHRRQALRVSIHATKH